jgi:hypothetical protein
MSNPVVGSAARRSATFSRVVRRVSRAQFLITYDTGTRRIPAILTTAGRDERLIRVSLGRDDVGRHSGPLLLHFIFSERQVAYSRLILARRSHP